MRTLLATNAVGFQCLLTHLIKPHRHCFIRDRHSTDKRKEKQSELVVADVAIAVLVNDMDGVLQVDEPIPVHVHNPEEKGPTKHRKYQHEYREPQSGRKYGRGLHAHTSLRAWVRLPRVAQKLMDARRIPHGGAPNR